MGRPSRHAGVRRDAKTVTRELKLALIVGFALVLGVTVLISDHLSKARLSTLETSADSQPQHAPAPAPVEPEMRLAQEPPPGGSITGPELSPDRGSFRPDGPELARGESGAAAPGSIDDIVRQLGGQVRDGEIRMPGLAGTVLPGSDQPSGRRDPNVIDPTRPAGPSYGVEVPKQQPVPVTPVPQPSILGPSPDTTPPLIVDPRIITPPVPSTRDYTVAAGDTAYKIAKKFYGRGEDWPRLSAANPGRIGANGQVREGVLLKVPATLAGAKSSPAVTPGKESAKPGDKFAAKTSGKVGVRTYTVKSGDTLGQIAQRELKTTKRMPELLALNSKTLKNPNDIRAGMVLTLPE
jgi:nucleoid-associated protein YgaU